MSSDFKNNRKSIRLGGYDYSLPGYYYITICTNDREKLFGKVIEGKMVLNEFGEIIMKWLFEIEIKYTNSRIDYYVIMPNHVHFILIIGENDYDINVGVIHVP